MTDNDEIMTEFGRLMSKTDSFAPIQSKNEVIEVQSDIFQSVWSEASELRKSGELLELGKKIQCQVVAIHGDYDPHPSEGVKEPLSKIIKDFHFVLLEKCGHDPWLEKQAKDKFYEILKRELR